MVAYGPQCTHLGCAYHWDESRNHFLCPCHTSVFSVDGAVVSGPAPRPLDRYETKVENGKLLLGPLHQSKEKGVSWLDHRTGIETAIRNFLYEEIPASSGWHQVFGSIAVFLFLVQAFTGALLAFNYAPTPGDAYNSLRYILTEVTGGHLIRGLHHWGASMLIVVVVLHMMQVFLYGAYKKPREATWMVGVVLLLLTMAYGLTGYLLPWDNRAYWGTVVATQIASHIPLVGPYLSRLLGGDNAVGVVTFARFYGLHVLLLPPATGAADRRAHLPGAQARRGARARRRSQIQEEVLSATGVQRYRRDLRRVRGSVRDGGGGARAAGAAGRSHGHHLHPAAGLVFPVSLSDAEVLRWAAGGGGQRGPAGAGGAGAAAGAVRGPRTGDARHAADGGVRRSGAGAAGMEQD